jgi:hypothetical protein
MPHPTLETFAWLAARIDDAPSQRAQVLAAAGLDEARWQRVRATWLAELAASDAPELASRFAQTYARARQHPEELGRPMASPATPRTDPPRRIDDEATTLDPPQDAQAETDLDRTAELRSPVAVSALPFRVPELSPPAPTFAPAPRPPSRLPATLDPTEMTLEVPCAAPPPPDAVLPFTQPMNARRQRLVRYDTATGKPLAQPYWIDDPTPPAR